MSEPSFIHLRCHSEFSLIDGILRIPDLIKAAKDQGAFAVALTDHVNFYGLVKFFKKAIAAGVKPIIGADLVLRDPKQDKQYLFTALCQNDQGYANLIQLISKAYQVGQACGMPVIEWSWLVEHAEGLLILSGAVQGELGQALLHEQQQAEAVATRWQALFPDRFYMELQRTEREDESQYISAALAMACQLNLPVVATNNVMFLQPEDFQAHEARVCIHDGFVLDDPRRPRGYSQEQYLKTPEQMQQLFADIPSALANTVEIAKRCNVKLSLGTNYLPAFPIPDGMTTESYLEHRSKAGLNKILARTGLKGGSQQDYDTRLQIELDVINQMGFPGYFLIVADFIQWAKDHDIPVGPGRGSGAGSLVAYALCITDLDPLEHDLLFERFLNPERVSMPDFDIDFCMERRDEVIQYVSEAYGREAVSQIITFGTMAAKAVVRDVGRVLGMPYGFVDKIAKLIPFELGMTLDKALEQEEQLKERYQQDDEVRELIDLAKKLEGVTRNVGKHAGGVLIAPTRLTDFTPVYCEEAGGNIVSQYDKDDVEAVGLVKFDFLGLRTLTIIKWAVDAVNKRLAKTGEAPIDIGLIPTEDSATFDLLKSCQTSAVFQLESRGMKDLIKRLQPDCFDDITALVALFRPGPLQSGMVDDFIARKHGEQKVEYPHPDLEPILKPTYGVILYQEQVMQIAQVLASYTLGGADILRRAMGKKKPEEMAKQRLIFTEGAVKNGIDEKVATYIFDLMEKFAGYGFNKSHSAAYALVAYQTAWLKAHYPAEFMASVLSSDMDNTDKVVGFLDECKAMRLKVNLPNVNVSNYPFVVNNAGAIEYGLGAIKGVGEAVIVALITERTENGLYTDLFDFCQRLQSHKLNRRVLEALIKAGAMDDLGPHRAALLASVDKAIQAAQQALRNEQQGQDDLFGAMMLETTEQQTVEFVEAPELLENELLNFEKETLGWYASGHPLTLIEHEFVNFTSGKIIDLARYRGQQVTVAGMILAVRVMVTRTGKRMAVFAFEDMTGKTEVTAFSDIYEDAREQIIKGNIVVVKGEVERDDFTEGYRIRASAVADIGQVRRRLARRLLIKVHGKDDVVSLLPRLSNTLSDFKGGKCPVVIAYQNAQAQTELQLGDDWAVEPGDELLALLKRLAGNEAVMLEY